jgi:hypothetical protein
LSLRVGIRRSRQGRNRGVGEGDVDPGRLQRRFLDAEAEAQRAMHAHESQRLFHRRDLRRDPAKERLRLLQALDPEKEEVLMILVESGDDVALDVGARRGVIDRLRLGAGNFACRIAERREENVLGKDRVHAGDRAGDLRERQIELPHCLFHRLLLPAAPPIVQVTCSAS